jgi:hypothetical protein
VKVFIAGPYTLGDVAVNVREACLAAEKVWEAGHLPFVPLLYHLWHLVSPHEYRYWTDLDNAWLAECDVLLRLPGESVGADNEVALADLLGTPVVHSVEELRLDDF